MCIEKREPVISKLLKSRGGNLTVGVCRRDISYSEVISHNQNNIWPVSRKAVYGCKAHGAGPQSEKKETELISHVWSLKFYKAWYKHTKRPTVFEN
jgi:hypothetical protein